MSSRNVRLLTGRLMAAGLFLLALEACGRKGDPQPPPRKNPARTTDLRVEQRGQELVLSMSYPTMTVGGLALPSIDRLELVRYTRPAPEFMPQTEAEVSGDEAAAPSEPAADEDAVTQEPGASEAMSPESPVNEPAIDQPTIEEVVVEDILPPAKVGDAEGEGTPDTAPGGEQTEDAGAIEELIPEEPNPYLSIRVDRKEFDKQSETVLVLEGADLEAAVVGGRIVMRIPLDEIANEPPVAHSFAVETFSGRLRSPQSAIASFVPLPPPGTPLDLATTVDARGVTLSWSGLEDESEIEGYRVLRRPAQSNSFAEPLATVEPGVTQYFDVTARFGNRYVYSVTAIRMEEPLVEGPLGEEREVDYLDTFAPRPPQGLVVLAESGRVRLLWDAGRERDIAGYLVLVSVGGDDPQPLTPQPITTSEFVHEGIVSGATYVYTVIAVDTAGNRSEASSPATTRAP